jgi:hypothetical protein
MAEELEKIVSSGSGHIITQDERKKLAGIEDNAISAKSVSGIRIEDGHFKKHTVSDALNALKEDLKSIEKIVHEHSNINTLRLLTDPGSGKVITSEERNKLRTIDPYAKRISGAQDIPFSGGGLKAKNIQEAIIELSNLSHAHDNIDVINGLKDIGSGKIISSKERDKLGNIEYNAKDDQEASEIVYDNASSGLKSINVQAAIDEILGRQHERGDGSS